MYQHSGGYPARSPADFGMCTVHQRRRLLTDLTTDVSGQMRCIARKECRPMGTPYIPSGGADRGESAVCQIHKRRRLIFQMSEVSPGVYECTPQSLCRVFASSSNPMAGVEGVAGSAPAPSWDPTLNPPYAASSGYGAASYGTPLAPLDATATQQQQQQVTSTAAATVGYGGAAIESTYNNNAPPRPYGYYQQHHHQQQQQQGDDEVWCVRHARRISRESSHTQPDGSRCCVDSSTCFAIPIEMPETLRTGNCTELMCLRHGTMRSLGFLAPAPSGKGYVCGPQHPCRHIGLQRPAVTSLMAESSNTMMMMNGLTGDTEWNGGGGGGGAAGLSFGGGYNSASALFS